jgi:hypothetical protein
MAEVRISHFGRMLEKVLFPDNSFVNKSMNRNDPNVKQVEIPQSTGSSDPIIGGVNADYYDETSNLNTATELDGVIRVNDQKVYPMIIMRPPNPFVFETLQEVELSYNKAAEVAQEEGENMNTGIANYLLTVWAPTLAARIIPTTGLDKSGTLQTRSAAGTTGSVGGYAGDVKRFAYEDLMKLSQEIRKQNVTGGTWYVLPTVEIWDDIKRIDQVIDFEKTGQVTKIEEGLIGKWGKLYFLDPRQNDRWEANILYDITVPATPVPVAYGGALNANCVSALIAWNDKKVERNLGPLKFFSRKADPQLMGDISNWGRRVGGSSKRLDEKGVIAFYEAPNP